MSPAAARWWRLLPDGRVQCELCPHACQIRDGTAGRCGVRRAEQGALVTEASGGTSGLAVDPIEKKPLYHFLPGSQVLSFGTRGCNLACSFCQNWHLSDSAAPIRLRPVDPAALAELAWSHSCASLAFTYNEPIISAEYCVEVAQACRERGIRTVAVTNGFLAEKPREAFFGAMDAANVDLKAFRDPFYREQCGGRLAPVLETLAFAARSRTWLEVTTLLIPGLNDGVAELDEMAAWFREHVGPYIPWHFSAFHPDHRLLDRPPTSAVILHRARDLARQAGVRYVYLGNLRDPEGSTTPCPACGADLIERAGYLVKTLALRGGRCRCGEPIPGVFA